MGGRRRLSGKTALITGASGGIGLELADLLADEGADVVLVARDGQKLEQAAEAFRLRHRVSATVLAKDLAAATAPAEIAAELSRMGLSVDCLVNNAGFGAHGLFAAADLSAQLSMIQVNVTALTHLTRLLLPSMVERRQGWVLNVASTAAFQPGPLMAVYYATKAYVLSFSEALASEFSGSGVVVTALCPGPTTTGFQQRAGMGDTPLMRGRIADARSVALAGLRGLLQGKTVVIPGLRNRILAFSVRFMPRRLVVAVVRSIQEKRKPHAGGSE